MAKKKTSKKVVKQAASRVTGAPLAISTRDQLRELDETTLTKRVLIPLFRAMGYEDVRYTGGTSEQGKDVTMWSRDDSGLRIAVGVVVKAEPITGKAANSTAVTQVLQCLGSQVLDRNTNFRVDVTHCIVVTYHTIGITGENALEPQLKTLGIRERVRLIDGQEVFDLLRKHRAPFAIFGNAAEEIAALNELDPFIGVEFSASPKGRRVALVSKSPDAPPLVIGALMNFPNTPEGSEKRNEFISAIERGTPFSVAPPFLEHLELPAIMKLLLGMPDEGQYSLEMSPSQASRHLPASLAIFNDADRFDLPYIDFHVVRAGTKELVLSNDTQHLPFTVTLTEREGHTGFDCALKTDEADFDDLYRLSVLTRILRDGGTIVLRTLDTGLEDRVTFAGKQGNVIEPQDLIERVVRLAKKLGTRLKLPNRLFFTDNDQLAIARIEEIIENGRVSVTKVEFTATEEQKKRLKNGALLLEWDAFPQKLLDTPIQLGPWRLEAASYDLAFTAKGTTVLTPAADTFRATFSRWER